MQKILENKVTVLIATCNRLELLTERSLPSVNTQNYKPDEVLIVNDGQDWKRNHDQQLELIIKGIKLTILNNKRAKGAAGAWNTGLEYLMHQNYRGYVAILDDDDTWDPIHLEKNIDAAITNQSDVVISGLRISKDGNILQRRFIEELNYETFLIENPGWQGSNTFVSMRKFLEVGGFRDGLLSCNDRDLAIRILKCSSTKYSLVKKWTATWDISSYRQTLSTKRSESKRDGLGMFYHLYSHLMSKEQIELFFDKAFKRFEITRIDIENYIPKISSSEKGNLRY